MGKKKGNSRGKWPKMFLPLILIMIFSIFSIVNPVFSANISGSKSTFQPDNEPAHPEDVYLIGQDVYYNLEVKNDDDEEDSIVEIRDTDPSGVEWWYDFATGEWVLVRPDENTTITPGGTWEGTFVYNVEEDALFEGNDGRNRIRNAFTAIGKLGEEEIEVRVTKTSFVVQPEITVDKTVSHETSKVGDTVTYTVEITNTGDWALEDVSVIDSLLGDISASFPGTLEVNESVSEEFDYEIEDQDGALVLVNEVDVSGTAAGFDTEIEGAVVTADDEVEVSLVYPEISIEKEADREVAKLDSVINYTVIVTNEGDVALEVLVDDTLEGELFGGIIDAGDFEEFIYSYTVTQDDVDAGSVTNTATAFATLEWLDLDNEYEVEATVEIDTVTPEIQLIKTADLTEGYVGDVIIYTICIENIGDYDLENIVVTDPMLGGVLGDFPTELSEGADAVCLDFDYTIQEGDRPGPIENTADVYANPVGMDNDITDYDDAEVTIFVESLLVEKTAVGTFNRSHSWDIDKWVLTENEITLEDGTPKIWLWEDGSGDETATWYVRVTYLGYFDVEFNVSGTVTITNNGDGDAEITGVEDALNGLTIDVDFGVEFPYTLHAGETLEGTYSQDIDDFLPEVNEVTVTTERESYSASADVDWSDEPEEHYRRYATIEDDSDLNGLEELGQLDAVNLTTNEYVDFHYDNFFAWVDYDAPGPHIYKNIATIVETGDYAEAVLVINVPEDEVCWGDETAWAYGDDFANPNWDYAQGRNWGWTNKMDAVTVAEAVYDGEGEATYVFDLYAGAAQNDIGRGALVGTVTVDVTEDNGEFCITVTYDITADGFYLGEAHLWVGNEPLPRDNRGRYTNAPGQFPYGEYIGFEAGETMETTWTWSDCGFEGDIYVAAHAVVWMEVECEEYNNDYEI